MKWSIIKEILQSSLGKGEENPVSGECGLLYMTIEEILVDFPELAKEDILASLAFAADVEKNVKISL